MGVRVVLMVGCARSSVPSTLPPCLVTGRVHPAGWHWLLPVGASGSGLSRAGVAGERQCALGCPAPLPGLPVVPLALQAARVASAVGPVRSHPGAAALAAPARHQLPGVHQRQSSQPVQAALRLSPAPLPVSRPATGRFSAPAPGPSGARCPCPGSWPAGAARRTAPARLRPSP